MRKKILVVDDEPEIREMLKVILGEAGYEIYTAEDGKDAMRKVQLLKPDVILLDISMPRMDGAEVCLALKEKKSTENIPVILMTALGEKIDKLGTMRQIGGFPTFVKPFDTDELLGTIRETLDGSSV